MKNVDIKENRYELMVRFLFWMITAAYGIACFYLFFNQSTRPLDYDNRFFQSDLPYHISMVVDDGWYYSLTALIYLILFKIDGGGTFYIALFLALVSILTVLATEKLLKELGVRSAGISCSAAILLNLVMPFYVKWAGAYRYVSYQAGNVWHNSTYQCMKLGALMCMLLYLRFDKKYDRGRLVTKDLIQFAIVLAITTFIKPSFLTVFAPAFAVILLWDLIKHKVKFVNTLLFGITVLPACGVMLWQNSILFGDETEHGFKISFMETFMLHADRPKVTIVLSLAFPIVIFISQFLLWLFERKKSDSFNFKYAFDRKYVFSIIMAAVGFLEAILLVETGSRSRDGNFLWGYSFAMFWLYLISFKKWHELLQKRKWIPLAISSAVLIYQFICGAIFFSRLMYGETYFMMQ